METILRIVDKTIHEFNQQLKSKNLMVRLDPKARQWLAEHGYDPKMGARPLERLVQEKLKKPIADELLFGTLMNGSEASIQVTVQEGELVWKLEEREAVADQV